MNPVDVNPSNILTLMKKYDEDPRAEVGDHVRISKYKKKIAKGYTVNWSEEFFVIKKVKNTVPWIRHPNGEEIENTFYKKELQQTNQIEFRIEKVIERNDDKLCVKWKGYYNSFNSWID